MDKDIVKTDTSKILMSDVLKDKISDFGENVEKLEMLNIYVIVYSSSAFKALKIFSGILRGVVIGNAGELEIEMRLSLDEAVDIIKSNPTKVASIELQQGEDTIRTFNGSYDFKSLRVDEIDTVNQLCVLGMHLQHDVPIYYEESSGK